MAFGPDLSRWFGSGAFLGSEDVEALKNIVHDYHTTMDNVREAADSVSYLAQGIGQGLRGLGINGPWQEIGNPYGDMYASNVLLQNALPGVTVSQSNTPAQNTAQTQILLGEQVSPDLIGDDPNDPYTVTPDYIAQTTKTVNEVEALPGEAVHYVSDTISKYFHYALIAGIVVGVVIFLPEIKAVTRTLRKVTE